ncbi:DUF2254 domain-containing protein [Sphingosinithalassobacter sp. LHW66-3]|uniref:DUF2254 domain-containing protein n=1 Tax=Sphingosinithalassobacter sp. LHW66-3 TaxID=3424718 RepID=UPI003D6AA6AB
MKAWLRQIALRLNASYWFLPTVLTLAAILLSFATYAVDRQLNNGWAEGVSWLHDSTPDGARALLSTIAGSMISVAGTVFAITIAAVVYASGNYGPRLLTNFMTDRGNQLSLGVFIATFVYCLLVLRTVHQPEEAGRFGMRSVGGFVPELSLVTAFLLTLLSVAVLVYFLHHVPDSIRINRVVASIGRRALHDIEARYPDPDRGTPLIEPNGAWGAPIRAGRAGYIEIIDFETLGDVCERQGVQVRLAVRSGDFIHSEMPLLHVDGTIGEGVEQQLRRAFALGESRTSSQDIEFSIDELVEIALRALSPGINDPFTAITCLHWLSAVTAQLARRDLGTDADGNRYGTRGVHALVDDFDHFLRRAFGEVRASAAANPLAAVSFVDALEAVAAGGPSAARVDQLRCEARLLLAQAETVLEGPALARVRDAVERFAPAA